MPKADSKRNMHSSSEPVSTAAPTEIRLDDIDQPRILMAVEDQHGVLYYRFGTSARAHWFSHAELLDAPKEVFKRVSTKYSALLTASSQKHFVETIEGHRAFRSGLVASRPGHLDGNYVFPDGRIMRPEGRKRRKIFAAFEADPRFKPSRTYRRWERSISPIIENQPYLLFALATSLMGPMLRHVPPGYAGFNPLIEFCGPPQFGKSYVATMAAAVWCNDPESETGGAATWDTTLNALDDERELHNDGCVVLDENNSGGTTEQSRRELIHKGTFKLFTTASRRRYGDKRPEPLRYAVVSTSNTPLADIVAGDANTRDAVLSRWVTIMLGASRPYGILDSLPKGYEDSGDTMDRLKTVIWRCYGRPGRHFVKFLVNEAERDARGLRRTIHRYLQEFRQHNKAHRSAKTSRMMKTFGLVYATSKLAARAKILPKLWGNSLEWCSAMYREAFELYKVRAGSLATPRPQQPPLSAMQIIRNYIEENRKLIKAFSASSNRKPMTVEEFNALAGLIVGDEGKRCLIVPKLRFESTFKKYKALAQELLDANQVDGHGKARVRAYKEVSRKICVDAKAYHIYIDEQNNAK